jgi:hypothetical protein
MFWTKKGEQKEKNTANVRLAKKLMGKESTRKVFGFICNSDIPARLKLLAGKLNVPLYAVVEHALQLASGQIAMITENQDESVILRRHLIENHVEARTIEKISPYDEDMAERLSAERFRRLEIDKAAHQIVMNFVRKGLSPKEIPWLIEYGMRCRLAIAKGMPIPKDLPPDD